MDYQRIAYLKQGDVVIQVLAAIVEYLLFYGGLGRVGDELAICLIYLVAITQVVSCIAWIPFSLHNPVPSGRRILQRIFLIPALILLPIALYSLDGLLYVTIYIMLWLGPALGLWYFILTILEIRFYKRLAGSQPFEN